ncbi:cytochrome P450 [Streptomyces sp. SID10815]|uniref:cytochrome P450 n=1 Tax=Streptomyces sp. SID10815 TaxID=2706027 RepID=UPI0013C7EDE2|nr:cytochrome P450 [Streptomyces sp. SID10815]NEA49704.1 cytochrome P450 [Streptomyces sp. SID10815]
MSGTFDHHRIGPLPPFLAAPSSEAVTRVRMPTGDHMWLITDYAVGRAALADTRLSRAAATHPEAPKWGSVDLSPNSIMSLDGADHARLRRVAAAAFTSARVTAQAAVIEEAAGALLDQLQAAGPGADLVSGYASPLPMAALSALLGVPAADRPVFDAAVTALFDMTPQGIRRRGRHILTLIQYMSSLIERKRDAPEQDLLSALVQVEQSGEMSRTELINLGLALLMAGYETTAHQLSLAIVELLTGDALAGQSVEDTVEELLRTTPSTPISFPRVAVEDLVLGGTTVRRGEAVIVSLLHCNHDAEVFGASGAKSDARRPAHLTFGHGAHRCMGAPLVLLQMKIALTRLWQRFPGLRLAPGDEALVWREGLATRGVSRLVVEW